MTSRLHLARRCALPAAAGLVVLASAPASAHVTISPGEAPAGSYAVLTASVPHGCDGSPTKVVAIKMPPEILSVTPTRNPLWTVRKVMEKLPTPVTDVHGNQLTERVGKVVYSARTPLPDGYRDAFELSLRIPDDAAGRTLVFPVVQTCAEGETAWVETAGPGSDAELEAPAPTVAVVPAESTGHAAMVAPEEEDSNALGVAGLVAGLLGLAAGVAALVQVGRRS